MPKENPQRSESMSLRFADIDAKVSAIVSDEFKIWYDYSPNDTKVITAAQCEYLQKLKVLQQEIREKYEPQFDGEPGIGQDAHKEQSAIQEGTGKSMGFNRDEYRELYYT